MEKSTPRNKRTRTVSPRSNAMSNQISVLTMRQLGKLTTDDVSHLDHPVPLTSNGQPAAWLVPMTAGERRRAELIANGRLRPDRPEALKGWQPLPAWEDGISLSDALLELRQQENR